MKTDKKNHPMPEPLDGQALIVVVSPAPRCIEGAGRQLKIHANDRVEAVNKCGTYSWFHLEPGEYQLAAQAGNVSALQIAIEAGMEYYFLQSTLTGTFKSDTALFRHSKELVMYELNGAYHSVWQRKE